MKWPDIVITFILAFVSFYIFYDTGTYPEPIVPGAPGAALFPRTLALMLLILSLILFIKALRRKTGQRVQLNWQAIGKIGLSLILAIAFWALLNVWDIFIMMPILLVSIMVIMGERRIKTTITVAIIFDVFIYVVFYRIFHVMLPTIYF